MVLVNNGFCLRVYFYKLAGREVGMDWWKLAWLAVGIILGYAVRAWRGGGL
jgi:hypothetical protein